MKTMGRLRRKSNSKEYIWRRFAGANVIATDWWFSPAILIVAFLFWVVNLQAMVPYIDCHYAAIWLGGWLQGASPFQLFAYAILLLINLWTLLLVIGTTRRNLAERIFQGLLLFGLSLVVLSLKAHILPNSDPSKRVFHRAYNFVYGDGFGRIEEHDTLFYLEGDDWIYDYPKPPVVQYTEHPADSPVTNPSLSTLFPSYWSPLPRDLERIEQCVADYPAAVEQYHADQKILDEYWEGFSNWYALNKDRYENEQ